MTDRPEPMLSIASFSLTFGEKKLFDNFSLEVARGEKITVSGESGSGKSTLLKTIIGIYPPEAGTIIVEGKPLQPQYLQYIRRRMFYLPQDIFPHGDETVSEYLRYPFSLSVHKGTAFPHKKMEELLAVLRLDPSIVSEPLSRLSGGERKRVGVLSGLLLNRSLMLLDEPTSGVDAGNRDILVELLFTGNESTVIAVSHDKSLRNRSDRTIILENMISTGTGR